MTHSKKWMTPMKFLAIPLVMYTIWVLAPIVQSMVFSLTDRSSILIESRYIGLANFFRLLQDSTFHLALWNNLQWMIAFIIVPIPLGLAIAMFFNQNYPGTRWFKTAFFIPMTLSFAVIGTIWAWIYHPNFGALNTTLRMIGLDGLTRQWLGDPNYMTRALIMVGVWRQVPYVMILYIAGLKNVPTELIEASMIDGANWLQRFKNIVLPMLKPATIVAITISIIDSLRAFDIVYVMTNAQPRAAQVLASYMYTSSFQYQDYGYGSAIAVIQFLITLAFILFYVNITLKKEEDL
ncbi:carbohydrate ABC transporter permease [Spirochaeta africana]|uniref:Permease component of ABC-type sugar transporter n=1 Tax=Spirochaeta africana (strain ATCC 700263 / DSM 8902 / Z-7692) TaxID=889378 RepID=H9UHP4_SPIAZ|nr:sugar ABC transporter permease [Spirochaeta africana]AFG37037.1 permease component of ABC-type sugar transporter [Spirochaeta africana DSM 8902]